MDFKVYMTKHSVTLYACVNLDEDRMAGDDVEFEEQISASDAVALIADLSHALPQLIEAEKKKQKIHRMN